jgi:putative addiction module antidote
MHRELKLRKAGKSVGVVLPKEVPARLNARAGDSVSLTDAADGTLRVSLTKPEVARQLAVAQDGMHRYRSTLRELAKGKSPSRSCVRP